MNKNNIFRRIFVNTSSQIVAKGVTVILGFLTVGLLTRYLGVAQYGIYNLVFAYLAFFGIFADFGIQLSLVRDLSGDRKKTNDLKSVYFSIKLLFTIVSVFLSLTVLIFFPYSQTIKFAILVGSLAVGIGQMNAYGASILQAEVRLDLAAILDVINRIITVIAIVISILLQWGLNAIIFSVLIGNIGSLVVNFLLVPTYFRITNIPSFSMIKQILKSSFPIGVAALLATLYFKVDTIMLSLMKSETDVGIYSFSYKIFENIIVLWAFYMASVFPLLSITKNSKEKFHRLFRQSFYTAIFFSIFVIVIGYICAPYIINIFAGNDFLGSITSFRILIFTIPFLCIDNIIYYYFLIHKKMAIINYGLCISLVLNFLLNLIYIPKYGYMAASYITVCSELVFFFFLGLAYFFDNKTRIPAIAEA